MNVLRQDRSEFNCIFVHSELDDLGLDAQEFRIYAHLARRANGRTRAWPGLSSMTKACRMNRHTVIRAIRGLEERNLVAVRRKTGGLSEYLLTAPSKWKRTPPTSASPGTGGAGRTGAQVGTGAYPSTGARMGTGVVSKEALVPVPREALKGNPREGNPEKVLNTVGGGSRGPTASRAQRAGDGGRPASGPSAMNGQGRFPSTPRQESRKTDRSQTSLRRKAFAVASRLESLHWDNCKVAYALHAARSYAEQAMEDGHSEDAVLNAYRQALQYTHGVATDAMDRGERSRHELANPALTIYLARCALARDGKTVEQRRELTGNRLRLRRRKEAVEDQRLHEEALRLAPEVAAWFAEKSREVTPQGVSPSVIGPTVAAPQATNTGASA